MKNEEDIIEQPEYSSAIASLSNGDQVGITAFFVGSPLLAMGVEALGWGEVGFIVAVAGAGALGLAGKFLIDKGAFGDGEGPRFSIPIIEQLRTADWGALLRPAGLDEIVEGDIADEQSKPPRPRRSEKNEDRMVDLAPGLQLDIDDIAGKAIFVCGIRRSGKTNVGVHIAEELGRFDIPMLIPCLKGDWLSVAATLPNARVWGQGQIGMQHARAVGWGILERGMQLIFNIASYDDINEAYDILAEMILGLFEWEKAHPDGRRLCGVFNDEAQTSLPQALVRSIITDPEVRNKFLSVCTRVIAVGGSYGLFPVVMTQRIAEVNKTIIGQPELLLLFKQTLDIDLQRYQEFTDIPTDQVRALKQGQGIFVDYEGRSTVHKFHKRTSDDSMSSTPRYNPASKGISGKRFQASTDNFELDATRVLPETGREMAPEIHRETPETETVKVLREIGKRIKDGESLVDIRKSLGVNSGRAVQEINAALQFLQEQENEEE